MNYNKKILIPPYFKNPEYVSNRSQLLMFKFEYGNQLYLIFAGTYPGTTLLDAFDIRYDTISLGIENSKCHVHKGFNKIHKKYILPKLKEYGLLDIDKDDKKKEVILAGYSLGGALAILSMNAIISSGNEYMIKKCVTFGAPKLGDLRMHDYYKTYNKLVRIEYNKDIIPRFSAREFYNVGKKVILESSSDLKGIIGNHYNSYEEHFCN